MVASLSDSDRAARGDAERIAAERPFAGLIETDTLERVSGWKAGGRGSYFASGRDGRPFKLRVCASPAEARRVARHLARLPGLVPRLEARDGRYLLIERLVGYHKLDPTSLRDRCRALGRMYAAAHASDSTTPSIARWLRRGAVRRVRRKFSRELSSVRDSGVVEEGFHRRLRETFDEGIERYGLDITFEIRDFHMGNVMTDGGSDLRFVDEEGLGFFVKGLGYAKLLAHVTEHRFHEEFREGYAELADPAFLSGGPARLVRVVDGVHSVASKIRRDEDPAALARSLEALRRSLEPERSGPA